MSRAVILGYGTEGRAAAAYFLAHTDGDVLVGDAAIAEDGAPPPGAPVSDRLRFVPDAALPAVLRTDDLFLRSPGIQPVHPAVGAARDLGLAVTTPTGYWLAHHAPPGTLTITGTKGKSTTVTLTAAMLEAGGIAAVPLGNIGAPPLGPELPRATAPVLELSSYMMEDIPPGPYTHAVTNLFREHTTWHGTDAAYRAAKLRPFRQDPPVAGFTLRTLIEGESLPPSVQAFEEVLPLDSDGLHFSAGVVKPEEINPAFTAPPLRLAARAAAVLAGTLLDEAGQRAAAETAIAGFRGLPCRQEIVPSTDGRTWMCDTLATVGEAASLALSGLQGRPVTLLLGGADRGQDLGALTAAISRHGGVRCFCFGTVGPRMAEAIGEDAHLVEGLPDALARAASDTPKGGVVLFSPAAASEPPYADYRARAAVFRDAAASA